MSKPIWQLAMLWKNSISIDDFGLAPLLPPMEYPSQGLWAPRLPRRSVRPLRLGFVRGFLIREALRLFGWLQGRWMSCSKNWSTLGFLILGDLYHSIKWNLHAVNLESGILCTISPITTGGSIGTTSIPTSLKVMTTIIIITTAAIKNNHRYYLITICCEISITTHYYCY